MESKINYFEPIESPEDKQSMKDQGWGKKCTFPTKYNHWSIFIHE
jgi:hypothetical protein